MTKKSNQGSFDPAVFLATAKPGRSIFNYAESHVIFSQGDPANAVFYIQKGNVKIAVTSEQGKEAILGILGKGEFFGEGCLIAEPVRLTTATTLVDSTVMHISKAEMVRVLHSQPTFGELFMAHLLTRERRMEEELANQLFNSSEKRLARTLLVLSNFGKEHEPEPIPINISQETLAEMVGTTRSRINFFMNKFRHLGFIDYGDGDIKVHRSLLNVILHD
jgi:CRP/FNR family cyclic AMP-dependent transcriptional regulator